MHHQVPQPTDPHFRISTTKSLEDAERRYQELFAAEKQRLRKKEEQSKEIITQMSKKLKVGIGSFW